MAKTKEQKNQAVEQIKQALKEQKAIYFVNIENLDAATLFKAREALRKSNAKFLVAKKKLIEIAFKQEKIAFDPKALKGPIALIFGFEDEISPARIIYEFQKEKETPRLLGGIVEEELLSEQGAIELAQLPPKENLLTGLVRLLQAPIANFETVLQANIKGLLIILKARTS